jgi:hypothetical protein
VLAAEALAMVTRATNKHEIFRGKHTVRVTRDLIRNAMIDLERMSYSHFSLVDHPISALRPQSPVTSRPQLEAGSARGRTS